MGVRPPASDDIDDGPDVVEFGIPALDARLSESDLSFPVTAEQLEAMHGQTEVPIDASGHTMTVADALAGVDHDRFESKRDLLNALHPVFEQRRAATSTGLLAQLRSLMPF